MKTMLTRTAVALGMVLGLACGSPLFGDTQAPILKEQTMKGIATAVDQQDKIVSVRGFWGVRTFNVADKCKVSLQDKPAASLADLRPGQKMEIRYEDVHGVRVAHQIAQQNVVFHGYITAIDPAGRTLVVKHGAFTRNFVIANNCGVALWNDRSGSLNDLKIGNTVNVIYEKGKGLLLARKIEQPGETFVGTIQAIDADSRMVKAGDFLSEKTFHLADGCKIVVAGKLANGLPDLRIGDKAVFSYDNASGVLVADRIGQEPASLNTENSQATGFSANPFGGTVYQQ